MANTQVTDVYNDVLTTTLREYIPKMHDNIFLKVPFYMWMFKQGKVKYIDGGYEIIVPVMYGKNSTVGWYSRYDSLDTSPQEGMTVARFGWRQLAASVAIDRKSERQNSGKHQLINLLDAKMQQAEGSLRTEFAQRLFAGYSTSTYTTASGDTSAEVISLDQFMPHAAASNGVRTTGDYKQVGYIDGETETWWRCQQTPIAGMATPATLASGMATAYNNAYKGSTMGYPDLILTSQQVFQQYEINQIANITYTNTEIADMGFQNLKYKGATMMWDPHHEGTVAAYEGNMYFINSDHLYLVVDKETNFITTPFYRPTNQDARVCQILWMGNIVCNNRRALSLAQVVS